MQFLMAFKDDFKGLRGSILYRHSLLPSMDAVVNQLLVKKVRLQTLSGKCLLSLPNQTILVAPLIVTSNSQNKYRGRAPSYECSFYHEKGH